jgi:hypothetical protein
MPSDSEQSPFHLQYWDCSQSFESRATQRLFTKLQSPLTRHARDARHFSSDTATHSRG